MAVYVSTKGSKYYRNSILLCFNFYNTQTSRGLLNYPSYNISVFGVGSMIYSGIEIGMFFEMRMDDDAPCKNYFSLVRPILQMVYVFVQMYFVFLNQKVNIHFSSFWFHEYLNIIILWSNHNYLHESFNFYNRWIYTKTNLCLGLGWCTWLQQTYVIG